MSMPIAVEGEMTSDDFDTPATIIEAVRKYQYALTIQDYTLALETLRALRLPPVEEARRDR